MRKQHAFVNWSQTTSRTGAERPVTGKSPLAVGSPSPFANCSRTLWRTVPEHPATNKNLRTQCAKSLRPHTVRGLFGGRPANAQRPKKKVCEHSLRTVSVPRLFAAYFAGGPQAPCDAKQVRAQFADSLRSHTVCRLFGGRPVNSLRPKTARSKVCEQYASANCSWPFWRTDREHPATQNSLHAQFVDSLN